MTSGKTNTSFSDPLDDLNPSDLELRASEVVLRCPVLQPAANSFVKNFLDIEALYWLPKTAARELARQEIGFHVSLEALLKNENWRSVVDPKGDHGKYERECKALWTKMLEAEGVTDQIARRIGEFARENLKDARFRSSLSVVATSIASMLWTTFECLSKDLWVACVNSFPQLFAGGAFTSVEQSYADEGLSAKHVSVGILTRHGYDISHVLGTVLSNKYDFTGVQGINRAYKALFKVNGVVELQKVEADLKKLEAVRHVIVHNAGIADQVFVDRIVEGYSVGDPVMLTGVQLRTFAIAVKTAGKALLTTADRWVHESQ